LFFGCPVYFVSKRNSKHHWIQQTEGIPSGDRGDNGAGNPDVAHMDDFGPECRGYFALYITVIRWPLGFQQALPFNPAKHGDLGRIAL